MYRYYPFPIGLLCDSSPSEVNSAELFAGQGPPTGGGGRRGFSNDNNLIRDRQMTSSHGNMIGIERLECYKITRLSQIKCTVWPVGMQRRLL